MGNIRHPRRGSMQFWPRKRSKHSLVRIRSWADENKVKPLGFIGYKAGMIHVMVQDNRPKSNTKGEKLALPATIIDCPPMSIIGVSFYKNSIYGSKKIGSVMVEKPAKELAKKIQLSKKAVKKIDNITEFDDLRLLVQSNPKQSSTGTKKPKIIELVLGGNKDAKLAYAKKNFGKEIKVSEVFEKDDVLVDMHGITKGKGFQGTVKRYGVPIRQHKAEKTKRGIATLGSWTPKRVEFTVPQSGKMGYHLRTEYNRRILKIGVDGQDVTPKKGVHKYGIVKNNYALIYGSVVGSKKRAVVLTMPIRPGKKIVKEAFEIKQIVL